MALFFDGTDDELTVSSVAGIQAQRPMSAAAWIRRDSGLNDTRMFWKRGSGGGWAFVVLPSSNLLRVTFFTVADVDSTATIADQEWHHTAVTIAAGGTVEFYLDGVNTDSSTIGAPGTSNNDLQFAIHSGSNGVPDSWDEQTEAGAGIWTSVLTDGQIKQLYRAGRHGGALVDRANLQMFLPMDGLDSSISPDISGNKNNGSIAGPVLANNPHLSPYSRRFWGHGPFAEVAGGGGGIAVLRRRREAA